MTRRATLQEIREQQRQLAGLDPSYDRILLACQGKLRVRIGEVTHGHDGRTGLPRTLCGIRWVPNLMIPPTFPQGMPTEVEVDCMTCLVLEARS